MKKIAGITFHNTYNYGACLQTYAMQKVVNDFGYKFEYINYVNKYRANLYKVRYLIIKSIIEKKFFNTIKIIFASPLILIRAHKFKQFYKKYITLTNERYKDSNSVRILNNKYYKYIVGSDQVWNYLHNGEDETYFLHFVKDENKKISYSSSFGLENIPADKRDWYKRYLDKIRYISTREKQGVEIIKELINKDISLVLDPVFLIEKNKWNLFLSNKDKKIHKYIFIYINCNLNIDKLLSNFKIYNKHILSTNISIKNFFNLKTKLLLAINVEKFLEEIKNSFYVITTSFHGLAFSIIFEKQFTVVLSGDKGRDERLINLLTILDLKDRIVDQNNIKIINKKIDYGKVNKIILKYKKKSIKFLYDAIKS